jgi:hypothetical protein
MAQRALKWLVGNPEDPIFHDEGYTVEIMDEAGGEFLGVTSNHEPGSCLKIDKSDWYDLKECIDLAFGAIKQ